MLGFVTKNSKREFHPMNWWLSLLLLFVSVFSKLLSVTFPFENTLVGLLKRLFVLSISESAFLVSLTMIVVHGQRVSLREKIGLHDKFFDKERSEWKSKLDEFPNSEKILESLDEGRFVARLFDSGFFNLAILWSCNVVERIVDATTAGIISKAPKKKILFRTEEGRRLTYPVQLEKLGYESYNVETLWHRIRNKIAHHNYKPTFPETKEALEIIVSFVKEMPAILHNSKHLKEKQEDLT